MSRRMALAAIGGAAALLVGVLIWGIVTDWWDDGRSQAAVPAPAGNGIAVIVDCPTCPPLVAIPAGSFTIGSPPAEDEREAVPREYRAWSQPQLRIAFDKPFLMGRHEVTRGQFAAFVTATGYAAATACLVRQGTSWQTLGGRGWNNPGFAQDDSHPVVCISWQDAQAYVAWLRKTTGKAWRLPSESEWEYAARAGTATARYWGDGRAEACAYGNVADATAIEAFAWSKDNYFQCRDGFVNTAPVGSFRPNAFGLHDMLGNVSEWVADCNVDTLQGLPANGAPREATAGADCARRVVRSSSWHSLPRFVRAAARSAGPPFTRADGLGFRVVRPM